MVSVKKIIPNYATLLLTMKPEVESPLNRICISYNRRGHRTFAVFLLLFFIGMCRRAISVIRCRSTPSPSGFLHFQKFGLDAEQQAEPNIVADLLDEIEEEKL